MGFERSMDLTAEKKNDGGLTKYGFGFTTLEKSHRTGGMGHISAFPYAILKSWGCKMRASFCSIHLD